MKSIPKQFVMSVKRWKRWPRSSKGAASSISLGGFGLVASYASSLAWISSLAIRARAAQQRAPMILSAILIAKQLALAVIGFVAWRLLSQGPVPTFAVAAVVAAAWLALGITLAASTVSIDLARKPVQSN
jgi:uncharacterized membrane protein (DUF4010 family)